jgi:hypothetical protein
VAAVVVSAVVTLSQSERLALVAVGSTIDCDSESVCVVP